MSGWGGPEFSLSSLIGGGMLGIGLGASFGDWYWGLLAGLGFGVLLASTFGWLKWLQQP